MWCKVSKKKVHITFMIDQFLLIITVFISHFITSIEILQQII